MESIIKKNRPNLAMSTIKTYLSNLNSLAKAINVDKFNSVEDIIKYEDDIFKYLLKQNLNVRKTKLSSIIVVLDQKDKNSDKVKMILEKYRTQIHKDGKENDLKEEKQELNQSQKENYIPWSEVMKVYNALKIEAEPLFKLERINKNNFKKLQDYVLLSLYVLIPPRRSLDFSAFKLRNIDESKDNYMSLKNKKKPTFVFNQYKNSSRLGPQIVPIPTSLKTIIQKWILKNPYDNLIVNGKGSPVNQSNINVLLNDIFGKRISSSLLRHIYLTDKYGKIDLKDLQDTTNLMGSSNIKRTLTYVSKNNAKEEEED